MKYPIRDITIHTYILTCMLTIKSQAADAVGLTFEFFKIEKFVLFV